MKSYLGVLIYFAMTAYCAAENGYSRRNYDLTEHDVSFYLYTREFLSQSTELSLATLNIVNTSKHVKFIVHGYFESASKLWYKNMTEEYLKKGDYNVIQVDWSKPASLTYHASSRLAQNVGVIIGRLITKLHRNFRVPLNNIHVIGHSLGAHVSGYAGKEVIRRTGSTIGRITALDAAGPLFEAPAVLKGLTKRDARIVDAIHTDGGVFGQKDAVGTVDFFVNGGIRPQPGCSVTMMHIPPINNAVFCSHTRSYYYFISSINNEKFVAVKCASWELFERNLCGGNTVTEMGDGYLYAANATGNFFLRTNPHFPFAVKLQ